LINSHPKVLIVEDDENLIEVYLICLESLQVIVARTVREAEEAFTQHEFAAVVVDGHVKGDEPITVRLVRQMRFARPGLKIIANSSDDQLQKQLLAAGCSESCSKTAVLEKLLNIAQAA
jgi:DNA-binding NtrC family response regulator